MCFRAVSTSFFKFIFIKNVLVLMFLGWTMPIFSQQISVEMANHTGTVIRHTPKLTVRTGHRVWGQELNIRFQTLGNKDWHALQRFPIFGISILHLDLGAQTHGQVWAFTPNLSVKIWGNRLLRTFFRFGTGLAWVQHPYHFLKNPTQNALGSRWNSSVQFLLGSDFRLTKHWKMAAGLSFTHFSNGSAALPNFGVNVPAGFLGAVWQPQQSSDFQSIKIEKRPERRWQGRVSGGVTWVEYIVLDGPKYPIWMGSGAVMWQPNRVNRWLAGIDVEYNRSVELWAFHSVGEPNRRLARLAGHRLGFFLGDEFLFGAVGVQLQLGRYFGGKHINRFVLSDFYSKLVFRAYLPRLPLLAVRPHIGIYLKAHKAIAEYLALNVGADF